MNIFIHLQQAVYASQNGNSCDDSTADASSNQSGTVDTTGKTSEEVMQEYAQKIKEALQNMCDPVNGMSEEDQKKYDAKIRRKINHGDELTAEEMQYIRIHYPDLYPQIVRVQVQRKALEQRLKHCKSKQEVQEVSDEAKLRVSKSDPAREALVAAYNNVTEEFQKTDQYKDLPATEKEAKELEKNRRSNHGKNAKKIETSQTQKTTQTLEEQNEQFTEHVNAAIGRLNQYFISQSECPGVEYKA